MNPIPPTLPKLALFLGCLLLNAACAEDPFADKSQAPAFVGRDNSFTDPNATPAPGTER